MKKLTKWLAFLLAIALVTTTFGSNYATARVFAEEEGSESELFEEITEEEPEDEGEGEEEEEEEEETATEEEEEQESEDPEDSEDTSSEDNDDAKDEAPEAEETGNEDAQVPEQDNSSDAAQNPEDASSEITEDASTGSSEEVTEEPEDAPAEASEEVTEEPEDASNEASTEEDAAGVSEEATTEISQEGKEDISDESAAETSEEVKEDSEEAAAEDEEEVSDEAAKESSEELTDDASKESSEIKEDEEDEASSESSKDIIKESVDDAAAEGSSLLEEDEDASSLASSTDKTKKDLKDKKEKKEKKVKEEKEEIEKTKAVDDHVNMGDVDVVLHADAGILPNDAYLEVSKVSSSSENAIKEMIDGELGEETTVEETFSYDINIRSESCVTDDNPQGYVQPEDGSVEIRFEDVSGASSEDVSLAVYHVSDDLSGATEMATEGTDATDIGIDTTHFSIYTVVLVQKFEAELELGFLKPGIELDYSFSVNVEAVVDENGTYTGIGDGGNVELNFDNEKAQLLLLKVSESAYTVSADNVASYLGISSEEYNFDHAEYEGKRFDRFYRDYLKSYKWFTNNKLVTATVELYNGDELVCDDAGAAGQGKIKFVYTRNVIEQPVAENVDIEITITGDKKTVELPSEIEGPVTATFEITSANKDKYTAELKAEKDRKGDLATTEEITDEPVESTVDPSDFIIKDKVSGDVVENAVVTLKYDDTYKGKVSITCSSDKVAFFVRYPDKGLPGSAASQPKPLYWPDTTISGPQKDRVWIGYAAPFTGPLYDEFGLKNVIRYCPNDEIDNGDYKLSDKIPGVSSDDIIWYTYKTEPDGLHIDGYVSNQPTEVIYDKNDGTQTPPTYTDQTRTGPYTVLGRASDNITDVNSPFNLTKRYGYRFLGWSLQKDNVDYNPGDRFVLMNKTYLYAMWERIDLNGYYKVVGHFQNEDGKGYTDVPLQDVSSVTFNVEDENPGFVTAASYRENTKIYDNVSYYLNDKDESYKGVVDPEVNTVDNPLVLHVYYLRKSLGTQIVIRAASDKKVYDGTALVNSNVKSIEIFGNDADDYSVEDVVVTGEVTNVGTAQNVVESYVVKRDGKVIDPTQEEGLTVSTIDGDLEVTKRKVEIIVPSATKAYDGKSYTATDFNNDGHQVSVADVTPKSKLTTLVLNAVVSIPTDIKTVNASKISDEEITIDYTLKFTNAIGQEIEATTDNFDITVFNGDLVIEPTLVTIRSASLEKEFDGKPLINGDTPLEIEKGWIDGEGADYTFKGSLTKSGFAEEGNTFEFTPKKGTDFSNYTFVDKFGRSTVSFGNLTVTPIKKFKIIVTLHADAEGDGNDTHVLYNGKTQTADKNIKLHITSEEKHSEYEEEEVDEDEVIKSANVFSILKEAAGSMFGALLADARSMFVLKADAADKDISETVTYKGTAYTISGLKLTGGEGIDVLLNEDGSIKGYPIVLDYRNMKVSTSDGTDVTDEVAEHEDEEIVGYLYIHPREVTLTSASGQKKFDGKPLTAKSVTVSGKHGFADNEGAKYDITGSQTQVGDSKNYFTYELVNAKADNYIITQVEGTLKVIDDDTPVIPDNPDVPVNPEDPDDPVTPDTPDNPVTPDTPEVPDVPDDPDNPDNPDNPDDPDVPDVPVDIVTPPGLFGQVLGARRVDEGNGGRGGAAVLGARRSGTDDPADTLGRIITILVAAAIGFAMVFIKRRNREKK